MPLILRNFSSELLKFVFEHFFDIFKFKIEQEQNPRVYCFLMNEISKRVEKTLSKQYYDYFFESLKNKSGKTLKNLVEKGRVWGIFNPFLDFLKISE